MENSESLLTPTKTNKAIPHMTEDELDNLAKMWCEMMLEQLSIKQMRGGAKTYEKKDK